MKTFFHNITFRSIAIVILATLAASFSGKAYADGEVMNALLQRNGDEMAMMMELDLRDLKVKSNQAVVLTPMIVNGQHSAKMTSVTIYGRTRWYQVRRSHQEPFGGKEEYSMRKSELKEPIIIEATVPYEDWMNGSRLSLQTEWFGCKNCDKGSETLQDLARYDEPIEEPFVPEYHFVTAVAQVVKTRELSGRAYIDFPVNQTIIDPTFRNNRKELAKITATIDSVRNDRDITVKSLHISGTASPEGPYENNVKLAKGRTEALKDYVQNLYRFPSGFITTSYQPVDWEGLIEWLENNHLENKESILNIVRGSLPPFKRNQNIKEYYPDQYRFLLKNVYPSLRHSDYRIEYEIRQFSDIAEIAEIMQTAPQKLSLNEFYMLANSLEPGSEPYNEVFETAVRMYPNDAVANLNAANAAMMRGDLEQAERYLQKAGLSDEAAYARGILERLKEEKLKQ